MTHEFIEEISIKNFRGIKNYSTINLSKENNITFLVGANNSGKSLISRIMKVFEGGISTRKNLLELNNFSDKDFHYFNYDNPIILDIKMNQEKVVSLPKAEFRKLRDIEELIVRIQIYKKDEMFIGGIYLGDGELLSHHQDGDRDVNQDFAVKYPQINFDKIDFACRKLYELICNNILVFDAIRSFELQSKSSNLMNGSDLIEWLVSEESIGEISKAKRTVKKWLELEFNLDAPLAVRADPKEKALIFTFDDDIELSSHEVGTGYTMLYILLMEIVRKKRDVIIIDEIESHLQPGLIKVLINIIRNNGDSQFIVSTHSPTVIEAAEENDHIFRFSKKGGHCQIENFFRRDVTKMREVCNQLGVVPGDVLLSNVIIWVEGPSEIFWIRSLLKAYIEEKKIEEALSCNIIEGLHYSILMTGGNSISHLSFSEEEILTEDLEEDQFLNVLRVNPNPFVIIDSDNAKEGSAKSRRQTRLAFEINEQNKTHEELKNRSVEGDINENINLIPNLWLLKGKELENYAHPKLLHDFYSSIATHPKSKVTGIELCDDWNVYSLEKGAGEILNERGLRGVEEKSGTLKHKNQLSRYIFNNMEKELISENQQNEFEPDKEMISDLRSNLKKILDYILLINGINVRQSKHLV